MPSLTLPDRLIWFAHCPKAGGTSVEQFMVAHWGEAVGHLHWGWDLWWKGGGWRKADPPNSPQHLIWEDALKALPRAPDQVFALVRDPVARMASEYRWQRQGRRGTKLGKALACLPFSFWLRCMLALARLNPHAFDNHLRPQSDFIPENAKIFRLEGGMAPVLRWLSDAAGHPQDPLVPHAIATGPEGSTGPEEAARIAWAFAEDYARFGYERPNLKSTPDLGDRVAKTLAPLLVFLDRRGLL